RLDPTGCGPAGSWAAKHLCWRAEAAMFRGDVRAAFRGMGEALRLSGGAPWVRAWRGQMELWCGRYDRALTDLERALRDGGSDWAHGSKGWTLGWRGLAKLKLERAAEAVRDFKRALELKPKDPESHAGMVEALWRLGREDRARRALAPARRAAPGSVWPHVLASVLAGDRAAVHWRRAARICPALAAYVAERVGEGRPRAAAEAALDLCAGNRTLQPSAVQGRGASVKVVALWRVAAGRKR
ncbi:MAG: tetratricopeptide repeat protein, partial [Elusimicrobiota bacterium]